MREYIQNLFFSIVSFAFVSVQLITVNVLLLTVPSKVQCVSRIVSMLLTDQTSVAAGALRVSSAEREIVPTRALYRQCISQTTTWATRAVELTAAVYL